MKKLTNLFLLPALCLLLLTGLLAETAPADPLPTVPVGTVISYYGATAPEGYFACDGAEFDAAVYPKLAAVLGKNKVPDLRGYFIRGYGPNNDKDPDSASREFCSEQLDAIRNITGKTNLTISPGPTGGVGKGTQVVLWSGDFGAIYPIKTNVTGGNYITTSGTITGESSGNGFGFDASRQVPTAAENRPINKTLLYCIKHDEPEMPAPQPIIPDLRLGVEALWPMRYQGKQVYAKLVNFGVLPASGVRGVTHGILNIEWCQVSWDYSTVRKNDDPDLVTLGVVSTAPPAYNIQWRIFVNKNSLQAHPLNSINTNTAWSAVVCVLYTKTTDEPLP